jgi:hypothetical protein
MGRPVIYTVGSGFIIGVCLPGSYPDWWRPRRYRRWFSRPHQRSLRSRSCCLAWAPSVHRHILALRSRQAGHTFGAKGYWQLTAGQPAGGVRAGPLVLPALALEQAWQECCRLSIVLLKAHNEFAPVSQVYRGIRFTSGSPPEPSSARR